MSRVYTHFSVKDYFFIILIIVLSTVLAIFFQMNQIISGDQIQMLEKGYLGAMTGNYLPYGNAASTVGNVPGSLSSYIVGYPLSIYMHPFSPVALLILLRVLSIIIFFNAVSKIFNPKTCVIAVALYALSPWFLYDELIYNPSYLAFGSSIFLNMLVRLRTRGHKVSYSTSFFASLMLALSAGFCLQLHFSWPVLVAICGILYLRRDITISFIGIIVGLALVGVSLIPYINEFMVNEAIRHNTSNDTSDRYLGYGLVHIYPVFKSVLYWFRFGSLLVTKKALVPDLASDAPVYLEIVRYIYLGFTQIIGVVTVMVAAFATYKVLASSPYAQHDGMRFVRSLTVASLCALILAGGASTITFSYWHLILIFPMALLPVLVFIERSHRIRMSYILYLSLVMICMNIISAFNSDKFNINASYADQVNYLCIQKYTYEQCGLSEREAQSLSSRPLDSLFFGELLYALMPQGAKDASITTEKETYESFNNESVTKALIEDNSVSENKSSVNKNTGSEAGLQTIAQTGDEAETEDGKAPDKISGKGKIAIEVDNSSDTEGVIVLGPR